MVMVGTNDVAVLRSFYEEGLGWTPWAPPSPMSVMYKTGTAVIVFLDAAYLAAESGVEAVRLPKSLWALFVPSREEVDSLFAKALAAGAKVTSAVRDRDGGLYSGYFADPEDNGWEIVWSPHMPIAEDGSLALGG